jgi:hypothetical protein
MEMWQLLLQKGNKSFNHESWSHAEEYYHQAVECLEQKWKDDFENMELILAWISAFHNLAMLYEVLGKPKIAFRYLQIPHQRMTEITQQQTYSDSMQTIAIYALKVTLSPLLNFSKKHPACDNCLASLKKVEVAVKAMQPLLH